ncbi:PE-PPE domain-containing protein [Mycobacterium sp. G7A2]|uniref:PE-PPE domain-containing protein n=1 Tax=Mycobacterium sp. G7A2 TaxID=3317307 RepID=UPI0035A95590
MVVWCKRLFAAVAVCVLLLGTGTFAHAVSAEDAVLIPGATVFKHLNPVYPLFQRYFYPHIGAHFHTDDDPQVIDYSQNALVSDWAIRQGVQRTVAVLDGLGGEVVVIGESMGSMVAARVAAQSAAGPEPPSVDALRFVLVVPPEVGVAEYFKEGTFIPILNYRISRLPESPYPTTIVIGEYDGWSDPPDRPWNLVSLLNAVFGVGFVHTFVSLIDPADVPPENITVERNSQGGLVTTYFVPTARLPLTALARLVVPGPLVDLLDGVLRPIVDAGYRRHDEPGDWRPYVDDGRIVWPAPCPKVDAVAVGSGTGDDSEPQPQSAPSTDAELETDSPEDPAAPEASSGSADNEPEMENEESTDDEFAATDSDDSPTATELESDHPPTPNIDSGAGETAPEDRPDDADTTESGASEAAS